MDIYSVSREINWGLIVSTEYFNDRYKTRRYSRLFQKSGTSASENEQNFYHPLLFIEILLGHFKYFVPGLLPNPKKTL